MLEKIYFAKVREDAIIPSKRDEDAGYDIYPNFTGRWWQIKSHETAMITTGIASAIKIGYYAQLEERGSTGTKGIAQMAGTMDSGYRGEWLAPITNLTQRNLYIVKEEFVEQLKKEKGHDVFIYPYEKAICQAVIHKHESPEVVEITFDELKQIPSERGDGRLGSSKK